MAGDSDYSSSSTATCGYSGYEDERDSCGRGSMIKATVIPLSLTYTNSAGNTSAAVDLEVDNSAGWNFKSTAGQQSGQYAGGHEHGASVTGSVFYDGILPTPDDPQKRVFFLDGITTITAGNRSLRSGMSGSGSWFNPPGFLQVGADRSITWRVQ
jgi:hypothetical protein